MFDPQRFIADRVRGIDASGIRRVFDLASKLASPVNLSIGQPDFDVPSAIKQAAIAAIERGQNSYTVTQGLSQLNHQIQQQLTDQLPGWSFDTPSQNAGTCQTLITSGVSGGLLLTLLTCVGAGDEVLLPDPYFVMYKHLVTLAGATPVYVDTYPDFQLTGDRIRSKITPRTKLLIYSSPSNPTGVVTGDASCKEIVALADEHDLLVVSDEIYDGFCYEKSIGPGSGDAKRAPSPAAYSDRLILLRGFSKTYAMTGWRLGYAAGPSALIEQMTKLQQYTFVCAPSMAQVAGGIALDQDMGQYVAQYQAKRDRMVQALGDDYQLTTPGGAFYAFPQVPLKLCLTGSQFVEKAVQKNLLMIPGQVFSQRDTHFRLSYACSDTVLDQGLNILLDLAQ